MFEPLPAKFNFPEAEKRVLEFWQKHDVFGKSLELRRDAQRFVFYEGPPTANGVPHPGHCLTRAMKDLFPRYQTMRGCLVERKAGWDTHGLPVEIEVCRELGINSKEEIEAYGVDKFVKRCIESVFRYVREWEEMTDRLGFWINLDEAYVTYHQSYVESVWWGLKTLFERGLLYQGHKVVWWWAQGGTALSAGEVGEGYRTVEDPSVYIRFPLTGESKDSLCSQLRDTLKDKVELCPPPNARISLLVWTTTPWTLISNHFVAVHPLYDYALVHDKDTDEYFYIATDLVEPTAEKVGHKFEVLATCRGEKLIGLRYTPPFAEAYYDQARSYPGRFWGQPIPDGPLAGLSVRVDAGVVTPAGPLGKHVMPRWNITDGTTPRIDFTNADYVHVGWRVVPADFVTLDTGTGIVHQAPAYGEVDFALWAEESRKVFAGLPLLNAVAPDGTFTDEAPEQYRGRWVKDCDDEIMQELDQRGIMLLQETVKHEYPFCPRAEDDPLIQYARRSWFVRTSQFKEEFLKNNDAIKWLPDHIQEGRFGDFLRNNVDWALSRERYWGTPLPIWVCEQTGKMEAIGSYADLLAKPGVQGTEVWENAKKADPGLPEHLKVHKPYIDAITYDSPFADVSQPPSAVSPQPGAAGPQTAGPQMAGPQTAGPQMAGPQTAGPQKPRMRRVPEVIDCWWDAGSMPFAQWGFPHVEGSVETFSERFPCDFISEAIDQTRGWFYGLLAISTLLFGPRSNATSSIEGGTGVSPVSPSGTTDDLAIRRRTLPHWEAGGSTYFVTFRTRAGELSPEERQLVLQACRHWDERRLLLHAAAVLADHVHLLFTPLEKAPGRWWSLSDLLHSIKSYTGHEIAQRRAQAGSVWLDESYDRIIRNASDFEEKLGYILENAKRAGLGEAYPWLWLEPSHSDQRGSVQRARSDHRRDACATLADKPYPHPYKTCIVLGHVMGEDGLKMSKSTGNYREPDHIFDHYGADAMRWYFFSAQTPWTSIRFQEAAIRDAQREFLVRLYNVFSFFNIYANIDGFDPRASACGDSLEEPRASARAELREEDGAVSERPRGLKSAAPHVQPRGLKSAALLGTGWRPVSQRSEIDRWISSELHRTIRFVRDALDRFENFPAAGRLNDFVDALSNWYVRRSRERFWRPLDEPRASACADSAEEPRASARAELREEDGVVSERPPGLKSTARFTAWDQDKWDAYNTLYGVLVTLSKLIAPFTPFFAETMYQNLCRSDGATERRSDEGGGQSFALPHEVPASVHLCDYPEPDETLIDETLAQDMDLVRQIVSTGRAARTAAKLKVRQPLAQVEIILAWRDHEQRLRAHTALIAEELNVKNVEFTHEADHYVHYQVKANFKVIGPKFGKLAPKVGAALGKLDDPAAARKTLLSEGELPLSVDGQTVRLAKEDVDVRLEAKEGWSAAQGRVGVVVVSTELTPELREEGLMRELIHHVQGLRKQQDLAYEARITLYVAAPEEFLDVVRRFADTIRAECLAAQIEFAAPPSGDATTTKFEGHEVKLAVQTV